MKVKPFVATIMLCLASFGVSCSTSKVINLTPERIPQNPSGIYALSMTTNVAENDAIPDTVKAAIVIEGNTYPMQKDPQAGSIYEFQYQMPQSKNQASYYFIINYKTDAERNAAEKSLFSQVYTFTAINRYVITMQFDRSPIGTKIPVVGRGFSKFDRILIGATEAETEFVANTTLIFTVPQIPPNQSYDVVLKTGNGEIPMGKFYVDPAQFRVSPTEVTIPSGETIMMVLDIGITAPAKGFSVDVKTDIPQSIVMKKVVVPKGSSTVSLLIQGAKPGKGSLFINATGFSELVVPVKITSR